MSRNLVNKSTTEDGGRRGTGFFGVSKGSRASIYIQKRDAATLIPLIQQYI